MSALPAETPGMRFLRAVCGAVGSDRVSMFPPERLMICAKHGHSPTAITRRRSDGRTSPMALFDIPKDEDITSEARHWLDELRRLRGVETLASVWLTYGRSPRVLKARVTAEENL